jgi:hypothetical protein
VDDHADHVWCSPRCLGLCLGVVREVVVAVVVRNIRIIVVAAIIAI